MAVCLPFATLNKLHFLLLLLDVIRLFDEKKKQEKISEGEVMGFFFVDKCCFKKGQK